MRVDQSRSKALIAVIGLTFIFVATGRASDKKDLSERYKGKYLVVMREGLPLAICSEKGGPDVIDFRVRITQSGTDTSDKGGILGALRSGDVCETTPEPAHKGEVLISRHVAVRGKWLEIYVESLSSHAVTRGVGAFEHQSYEHPAATLMFPVEKGNEQATTSLVDEWLKPFDTEEEAAKVGNTASGAFVKEVKLGMTPAEVEAVLGVPDTKVDLGDKVLYKYKNMTVEFRQGKVYDVR